jgi:hypothetical protein
MIFFGRKVPGGRGSIKEPARYDESTPNSLSMGNKYTCRISDKGYVKA